MYNTIFSGYDFAGETMNTIDTVLSELGQPTDGLGPNWSPLDRLIHQLHMKDLWTKLRTQYEAVEQVNL